MLKHKTPGCRASARHKAHSAKKTTKRKKIKQNKHVSKKKVIKQVSKKKYVIERELITQAKSPPAYLLADAPAKVGFFSSIEKRLINFVHSTIKTVHYTAYKLGGNRFDPTHGVYVLDCSTYVDHVLQAIYPSAYLNLVQMTGSDKPTSQHYYDFFSNLSENSKTHWSKINDVAELRPGDILVFRYKNYYGNSSGHVMIVMDKPLQDDNNYLIRVSDSAEIGHSQDTRSRYLSGIGIGTLVLKVDPFTGQPYGYAWKVGSRLKRVNFAMGRPDAYQA